MRRFLVLFCLCLVAAQTRVSVEEQLWQHRNLGKAYYENQTTYVQAVAEFQKALLLAPTSVREQLNYGLALLRAGRTKEGVTELEKVEKEDPSLPNTWFSLGIVFRKDGEFERAITQLEGMIRVVPGEPVSHYNLGVLYKQVGKMDEAATQLETAEKLDPEMEAPHFQLYNIYRQAGRRDSAASELAIFQKLKKEHEGAAIPQDPEWCAYAEIYDPIDIKDSRRPAQVARHLLPPSSEGQLLIDVDGDGKAELLEWNKDGLTLLRGRVAMKNTGLEDIHGVVSAAAGDFDNDGLEDLCILTEGGPLLYRNVKGKFERMPANLPPGRFEKAVWLDYDHDYDLDLLLLGEKSVLLRNQGAAGFEERADGFPFVAGHAIDAVSYRWMADSKAFDLVVSYADHAGVLYADRLTGKYEAIPIPELPAGAKWLEAADVNNDSWLDIVSSSGTLLNRHGKFEPAANPVGDGSVEGDVPGANSKWIRI